MPNLVERTRLVLAVESDDFYSDTDDIVEALNASQDSVVSFCQSFEKRNNQSLRALDALRTVTEIVIDNSRSLVTYWVSDVTVPATLKNFNALTYNEATPLKELSQSRIHELLSSNAVPTELQSYYTVFDGNFRLYLYEAPDTISDQIEVYHLDNPTAIVAATESLAELPTQLENAVVYGAAAQLALKEQSEATGAFKETALQELQTNIF